MPIMMNGNSTHRRHPYNPPFITQIRPPATAKIPPFTNPNMANFNFSMMLPSTPSLTCLDEKEKRKKEKILQRHDRRRGGLLCVGDTFFAPIFRAGLGGMEEKSSQWLALYWLRCSIWLIDRTRGKSWQ